MIRNYDDYEAGYLQTDEKEHYIVEGPKGDVVFFPRFEFEGEHLYCDFKRIDPDLSTDDVKGLVFVSLLGKFFARAYVGKTKWVFFKDLDSGEESKNFYLG